MIFEKNFHLFVYAWIGFALILFPFLTKIRSPYRRHSITNWRCCNEELRLNYPLKPALHLQFVELTAFFLWLNCALIPNLL